MAGLTNRFRLKTLDVASDRIDDDNWKFTDADRNLIDRVLDVAIHQHRHTGVAVSTTIPAAPTLALNTSGGRLLPNTSVYYRYSLVNQYGEEEVASAAAVISMPPQLQKPGRPTLVARSGTLRAGDYLYAVSFYTDTADQETLASDPIAVHVNEFGGWTITPPSIPAGATGWNVYRKMPTDTDLYLIQSLPIGTTTVDDVGLTTGNVHHGIPRMNRTFSSNSVTVAMADMPLDHTWKIYRSYDGSSWTDSLLDWTPIHPYVDLGLPAKAGSPPLASTGLATPPKVLLTDAGEVTGTLSSSSISNRTLARFVMPGSVEEGEGTTAWVCEFSRAALVSLHASLGRGSVPAGTSTVEVGLDLMRTGSTDWVPVATDGDPNQRYLAVIAAGQSWSDYVDLTPLALASLVPGDALRPVITAAGIGATPTDVDLTIDVTLQVQQDTGV